MCIKNVFKIIFFNFFKLQCSISSFFKLKVKSKAVCVNALASKRLDEVILFYGQSDVLVAIGNPKVNGVF